MIKRNLLSDVLLHAQKQEITIIAGPRQAGKTTLMDMVREHLHAAGERTLYLNLDVEWDRRHCESQMALIAKLELELGTHTGFVFIDEIQRKENAGLFLKGLYDLRLPYRFIVSGSGSLELKEKIHESLAGRKRLFELGTIGFDEFVHHKTDYRYQDNLRLFFEIEQDMSRRLLEEYMNFGGYPMVVLEPQADEKNRIIDDIYRSVLERDVAYLSNIDKTDAFSTLIKLLAAQLGGLVTYSDLCTRLGIAHQTVKKYLWYAEKIFILTLLTPYCRNFRKEISKSPVPYFWDLGIRNYALGLFGHVRNPAEFGFLFQNFIYLLLHAQTLRSPAKLHFWRTKDRAEVDFVMARGMDTVPVEVKYTSLEWPEVSRSLRSFIEKHEPREAVVVNLSLHTTISIGKTAVRFLPYYELLFAPL